MSNGASSVPEPIVKIDNHTDAFATIVTIEFGDILGDLADTVRPMWMYRHCFVLNLLFVQSNLVIFYHLRRCIMWILIPYSVQTLQTASLRNLGLNIRRAKVQAGQTGSVHKFFITDARK